MTKEQEKLLEVVSGGFLKLLVETFGENLRSVMLYGSIVRGRFTDGVSDVNVLLLLGASDPDGITALGSKAHRMIRRNRINPLLLTEAEFTSSADVFPMEYLDIRDTRNVLHGPDITDNLQITAAHLRHQVEEQLRGSIATLRQMILDARGRARVLRRYLSEWYGSNNALFRGLLRLAKVEALPEDPAEVTKLLGEKYGVDSSSFQQWIRLREGEKLDPAVVASGTLILLVELSAIVDRMEL